MRMPVFSYFLVAGSALVGLLFLVSSGLDPNSTAIKTSQTVGVPEPFKPQPEQPRYRLDNVNFAAQQESTATKSDQVVAPPARQKVKGTTSKDRTWNQLAESPHDNLSIH